MTPQFRLTEPAIQDIEQIVDYIAGQYGELSHTLDRDRTGCKNLSICQWLSRFVSPVY